MALAELHVPLLVHLGLALIALTLLPIMLSVDAALWFAHHAKVRSALSRRQTHCPRGHLVELVGAWECGSCHGTFEGQAWSSCPHCGTVTHSVRCPCGLCVISPISPVYE